MIRTHPPNTKDRKSLVYWLIDRHNQVNEKLGKKVYTYEEVLKKYQDLYNIDTKDNKPNAILELSKDRMDINCDKNIKEGFVGSDTNNENSFVVWRNILKIVGVAIILVILYKYRYKLMRKK
jgi:hypothetical protein